MIPKPRHLGPDYAAQFADPGIVAAYHHRLPYPAELFTVLDRLIVDTPRVVLDLGCGTGEIARRLAERVERIDAVDPSPGMIARARQMPGGDDPRIAWIRTGAEDAPLRGPYALVTAGESLHWMEWDVVLPRLSEVLSPSGALAIVSRREPPVPWTAELSRLLQRFSTNREWRPYDVVAELEQRALFTAMGQHRTEPVHVMQAVGDYVESFHSRNGFSRDRMTTDAARAFDEALAALVAPHAPDGIVTLQIVGEIHWGTPAPLAG